MSENCSHNCSSCDKGDCSIRKESLNAASKVKKVIGIVSGKGGVGKSMITSLLAATMQRRGNKTAILDADITGPSIAKAFGVSGQTYQTEEGIIPASSREGIDIMSINLLLENPQDPVIWRGPVIAGVVKQFWTDIVWEDEEYMFIDMPPGTGDVPLTVFQSIPIDGIIVVTSPQELVGMIVEKAVHMAEIMNIPIIALIENFAYFECPDCGGKFEVFGESHADQVADGLNIQNVVHLPINPNVAKLADAGKIGECVMPELESLGDVLETIEADWK
ncbi:MAG: Mrp/NBP35 family ATP-binding protein [Firmicutes bacterium]|nr:Mrp/NBP35 family ATP-binding protein [Bacillota bacterium]